MHGAEGSTRLIRAGSDTRYCPGSAHVRTSPRDGSAGCGGAIVVPSSPDSARNGRSMYLLDGRRVTLLDLIEAGLLGPDSRLRFGRPRIGTVHYAVVTANGGVIIDDGQEFRSPSRAAAIAADMRTVDGWHAWVDESGRSLDSLRSELLDAVAREAITEETAGDEALAIPQRRQGMST